MQLLLCCFLKTIYQIQTCRFTNAHVMHVYNDIFDLIPFNFQKTIQLEPKIFFGTDFFYLSRSFVTLYELLSSP